jgi:hypothetical protein
MTLSHGDIAYPEKAGNGSDSQSENNQDSILFSWFDNEAQSAPSVANDRLNLPAENVQQTNLLSLQLEQVRSTEKPADASSTISRAFAMVESAGNATEANKGLFEVTIYPNGNTTSALYTSMADASSYRKIVTFKPDGTTSEKVTSSDGNELAKSLLPPSNKSTLNSFFNREKLA